MAKKQTRKSISTSKELYDVLKVWCEAHNISMSAFVEDCVRDRLGMERYLKLSMPATSGALEELEEPEVDPAVPQTASGEIVPTDPRLVQAYKQIGKVIAKVPVKAKDPIVNPCRREGCRKMELHEAGDCR